MWLFSQQAPEELTNGAEPLNKGHIYLTNTSPTVVYKAYFEQFQKDFKLFLQSRSEELTLDGIMEVWYYHYLEEKIIYLKKVTLGPCLTWY